jgi:hypothetical protein
MEEDQHKIQQSQENCTRQKDRLVYGEHQKQILVGTRVKPDEYSHPKPLL